MSAKKRCKFFTSDKVGEEINKFFSEMSVKNQKFTHTSFILKSKYFMRLKFCGINFSYQSSETS